MKAPGWREPDWKKSGWRDSGRAALREALRELSCDVEDAVEVAYDGDAADAVDVEDAGDVTDETGKRGCVEPLPASGEIPGVSGIDGAAEKASPPDVPPL